MTAILAPLAVQRFVDNLGLPLVGGKLFTYKAGTTTKQATYTDSTGGTPNSNPIILNFRGEAQIWLDPTLLYKFVLARANDTDPPANPFWTVDNISNFGIGFNFDNFAVDIGTTNNVAVAIPAITSPVAFTRIVVKIANTNTGATTISVNGGTAKNVTLQTLAALTGGELQANGIYIFIYDGAEWQLESPALQPPQIRTTAEAAAGVTIINPWWPPGYLDRYAINATPGTTDMTAAWTAADAQCAQGGAPIFCRRSTYAFASAISVDYRSEVDCQEGAILLYTGSSDIAFLTVGTAGQVAQYRSYNLPIVRRNAQSNWASEANIGVKFLNISNAPLIRIPQINGFTLGLQTLPAGGNGFQYNKTIEIAHIVNCKVAADLSNATAGYTNENHWVIARISVNSGVNTTLARYGVRVTSSDGAYVTNNNNVFEEPSFELNAADTSGEAVPILMVNGVQNHFLNCRDEGNDAPFVRESNASSENTYTLGYSNYVIPTIDSQTSAPNRVVTPSRSAVFLSPSRLIFDSGPMHKLACYYDGATNVHIPYVSQCDSGSATVFVKLDLTFNANYLDTTHGMSIFVETIDCKQFFVTRSCESGRGGRVVINCYDAAGSLITTAGSVLGSAYDVISATAQFGGAFRTGSDGNNDVLFTVTDAVKAVRVSIANGDASLRIRSFAVHSVNYQGHCAAWTGYEQVIPGANIGTAAPTAGTWNVGRLVLQAVPTVGQPKAWACTVTGTPGTWVSQGNL